MSATKSKAVKITILTIFFKGFFIKRRTIIKFSAVFHAPLSTNSFKILIV